MPFAPITEGLFRSVTPAGMQLFVAEPLTAGSAINWIGAFEATSPASWTSAFATVPHAVPEPKIVHSVSVPPAVAATFCSGSVTCELNRRNPNEPVSTRTLLIFWQLEVPGTQIVTEV